VSTFTAGVFQDVTWARRGVLALLADDFAADSVTLLARDSVDAATLIEETFGSPPQRIELKTLGPVVAFGPLLAALQGSDRRLTEAGLASSLRRAGFQAHDGHIFETLVGRGGILAAVHHEARAADALAKLHAYGGGNAAIGAWMGRV
jgi:hypothetical protein